MTSWKGQRLMAHSSGTSFPTCEPESGAAKVPIGKVFIVDEIVEAHRTMEENKAGGKIVITT